MSKYEIINSTVNRETREYYFVIKDNEYNKYVHVFACYQILPKALRAKTNEKYLKALKISDDCNKNELYKEILKIEPGFLFYIPEQEQSDELKKIALIADGTSLEFISKETITEELSNIAVSSNGLSIYYVPAKMQTLKMCREAIANNPRAILKVKRSLAPKLYQEMIRENYDTWANFTDDELIELEKGLMK